MKLECENASKFLATNQTPLAIEMRVAALLTAGISGVIGTSLALDHTWTWKHVAMPIVSLLDAETAHRAAVRMASWGCTPRDRTRDFSNLVSAVQCRYVVL